MSAEMLSAVRLADCRSTRQASGRKDSDGTSFADALGEAVASSGGAGTGAATASSSDGAVSAAGQDAGRADTAGNATAARSSRKDAGTSTGRRTRQIRTHLPVK